jgi:hypothetical protein
MATGEHRGGHQVLGFHIARKPIPGTAHLDIAA